MMRAFYRFYTIHLKSNQNYDDVELLNTCHEFLCGHLKRVRDRFTNLIIRDNSQNFHSIHNYDLYLYCENTSDVQEIVSRILFM